jgi:cyclophilin family peptidyl-prolyl cis-trans isomerase
MVSCKSVKLPSFDDGIYAKIITKKGEIILQLEFEKTPMTVANFISLADGTNTRVNEKYKGKRFYDGLKFHRVIKNFMIQGGDPLGTGAGHPGYSFKDEFHNDLTHSKAGILSMANSGKNTNGSQFFITHKATPHLNNVHSVFGHVVQGMDIVNKIAKDDIIERIDIFYNGKLAKKFKADQLFEQMFAQIELVKKKKEDAEKKAFANVLKNEERAKVFESGLKIYTIKEGDGAKPKKGETVKIHYSGYLRNGKQFDSSVKRNKPFKTSIGVGRVIKGWDEGVMDLKVGTKAILYIPAHLAYGSRSVGNGLIPANSDIIFEVELLDIIK